MSRQGASRHDEAMALFQQDYGNTQQQNNNTTVGGNHDDYNFERQFMAQYDSLPQEQLRNSLPSGVSFNTPLPPNSSLALPQFSTLNKSSVADNEGFSQYRENSSALNQSKLSQQAEQFLGSITNLTGRGQLQYGQNQPGQQQQQQDDLYDPEAQLRRQRQEYYQQEYLERLKYNDPPAYEEAIQKQYREAQRQQSSGFHSFLDNVLPTAKDIPEDSPFRPKDLDENLPDKPPTPEQMFDKQNEFLSNPALKDLNPLLANVLPSELREALPTHETITKPTQSQRKSGQQAAEELEKRKILSEVELAKQRLEQNSPQEPPRHQDYVLAKYPQTATQDARGVAGLLKLTTTPLEFTKHDLRCEAEIKTIYKYCRDAWAIRYPHIPCPHPEVTLNLNINLPFTPHYTSPTSVSLPMMILGLQPRWLHRAFRLVTPTFFENQQHVNEITDSLYYSPQRIQFQILKTFAAFKLGHNSLWTLAKLRFYKTFFKKRYLNTLHELNRESDAMAARTARSAAFGGVEHLVKLHHFAKLYGPDIWNLPSTVHDQSLVADRCLNDLFEVIEDEFKIPAHDAVRHAIHQKSIKTGNLEPYHDMVNKIRDGYISPEQRRFIEETEKRQLRERIEKTLSGRSI